MARILVVDDELLIVNALTRVLSTLGHTCLSTTSARFALDAVACCHLDLLVLDFTMPEMDGAAFARTVHERLAARCPPVLFVSAQTEACISRNVPSEMRARYVQKPFDIAEVGRAVTALLG